MTATGGTTTARYAPPVPLQETDATVRRARVVWSLMIGATVSWRPGVFYEGGVDPVVAAKAALSVGALLIAWHGVHAGGPLRPVGNRSVWLLVVFLALSVLGGWSAGTLTPNVVLAIRMIILASSLVLLVRSTKTRVVLDSLVWSVTAFALVAASTGLVVGWTNGRLGGGLPPLKPNELAMLCALGAIGLVWRMLNDDLGRHGTALVLTFLAIIWLTGSRTGLGALAAACGVMLLQARRLDPRVALGTLLATVGMAYLILMTDVVSGFVQRGGSANVGTLSSRTIAWDAAVDYAQTDWQRWMGGGLSLKEIPVAGQYWDTQLLDSSWMSALVQAGRLGFILLVAWVCISAAAAMRTSRPEGMALTGVVAYLVLRSLLESGLMDSTPAFLAFFVVSLLGDRVTRVGEVSAR